jgi:uncharacterized membrane protein YcjF (UPF0283 family)
MRLLIDPFMIAVYLFLIGLPVGALSDRITTAGIDRKNDWLAGIGTAVGGVAVALTFPILYPIVVVTALLTEIWVAAFSAVFSIF